jgi:spermidine synthase
MDWFDEDLHQSRLNHGYTQRFEVSRVVHRDRSKFQDLVIFENPRFGRVLTLDGVVQTTEKDEPSYHEMLTHVPLFAHGRAARVLIIGGGDGGALREVLRHKGVRSATLVELDRTVIDACLEHMPTLSDGAFDDARADVVIADGVKYVAESSADTFDVILVDSTDPIGPGEVLFTEEFYADCKRCLAPGGVLVTQNGVPFFQPDEVTTTYRRLTPLFADVAFYLTVVPSYVGGFMALGWASDDESLREVSVRDLRARVEVEGFSADYYSPEIHKAAFELPPFIAKLMS